MKCCGAVAAFAGIAARFQVLFLEHQLGRLLERAQRLFTTRLPVAALHQQDEIVTADMPDEIQFGIASPAQEARR